MTIGMPFDIQDMVNAPDTGRPVPSAESVYPPGTLWGGTWAGQQTYAVHAVFPDGSQGLVPCSSLAWEEQTDELACRISAEFPRANLEDGRAIAELITLGTPLTILAALQPALPYQEVARGIVEMVDPGDGHGGTFSVIAYDPIHALLTSELDVAFSAGTSVAEAMGKVCSEWEVPLGRLPSVLQDTELPGDLVYHGQTLADILLDLLDQIPMPEGEFSTGRWVWHTESGMLVPIQVGKNDPVYWLLERESALGASSRVDASGVVSKILITGVQDEVEGTNRIIGTYEGDASHGVRQKVLNISQHMTVDDVEKKAAEVYAEHGKPRHDRGVSAPDNPLVRRYDQIRVSVGTLDGYFAIESISHDANSAHMQLKLGNLFVEPLTGTFTLIDPDAIPPESTTGGDLILSEGSAGSEYIGSGPVSPAQVCALARQAGFPDPVLATAVSLAENRTGDPRAFSSTQDIGLWQVNVPIWGAKFGGQAALTDPVANARAAKSILDQQGWGAWTTYRIGAHNQFMAQAQQACAQQAQLPTRQAATSSGSGGLNQRLAAAMRPYLGTPYVFGGTSRSGIDCSGFTQNVFREIGVSIPRVAQAQYDAFPKVSLGQERPGDLVFFGGTYNSGTPVSHVGIVTDPNTKQMMHCGDP